MTTQAQAFAAKYVMNNMYLNYEDLNVSVDAEDGIAIIQSADEYVRITTEDESYRMKISKKTSAGWEKVCEQVFADPTFLVYQNIREMFAA